MPDNSEVTFLRPKNPNINAEMGPPSPPSPQLMSKAKGGKNRGKPNYLKTFGFRLKPPPPFGHCPKEIRFSSDGSPNDYLIHLIDNHSVYSLGSVLLNISLCLKVILKELNPQHSIFYNGILLKLFYYLPETENIFNFQYPLWTQSSIMIMIL